jgi:hypothetical protein
LWVVGEYLGEDDREELGELEVVVEEEVVVGTAIMCGTFLLFGFGDTSRSIISMESRPFPTAGFLEADMGILVKSLLMFMFMFVTAIELIR